MKDYNGFTADQRWAAHRWYKAQSRVIKDHCDLCGQTEGTLAAHSEDYSEPYGPHIGAYTLCYPCHMMLHCRYRCGAQWRNYREKILQGLKLSQPYLTKNWHRFCGEVLQGYPSAWSPSGPRDEGFLRYVDERT